MKAFTPATPQTMAPLGACLPSALTPDLSAGGKYFASGLVLWCYSALLGAGSTCMTTPDSRPWA